MADVGTGAVASMEFEHRKADGTLVSKGHVEVDGEGVHTIQEDVKGNILDSVVDRLGRLRIRKRRV